VIDETGFLKQGKASCGVARQYTGSAGKIANCQIGVFACYVSRHGHAFIDRALYLPKAWTDDPARMSAAHVPEETGFATKPALAATMIERAVAAKVPFGWGRPTAFMALDPSKRCRGALEKAMFWASTATTAFIHGARREPSPAAPERSRKAWRHQTGCACRQAKAPKAHGSMTGPIWSWRISTLSTIT
jgi:SRSO17 transposase